MALTQTQVSQLYVAIFNRASEGNGNEFWQTQPDMAAAATEMLATDDAQDYFGESLDTDQAFIEHIYLNTLNKTIEDDAEGIAFWVDALEGGETRGEVVASLVQAIESYGPDGENHNPDDAATVAAYSQFSNRVEVSDYMAENVAAAPDDYAQSTAFDGDLVVTDDPDTVISARAAVDAINPIDLDETITLTDSLDVAVGQADVDNVFTAPIVQSSTGFGNVTNTFDSGDNLDGIGGRNILEADLTQVVTGTQISGPAVSATTENIQEVYLRAQWANLEGGRVDNNVPGVFTARNSGTIDAEKMDGVEQWWTQNSRADIIVEDIRSRPEATTFGMDDTDPAVGYYAFFDPAALVPAGVSSFILRVRDIDTPANELRDISVERITFVFDGEDVTLNGEGLAAANTWADLQTAIETAIADEGLEGIIVTNLGDGNFRFQAESDDGEGFEAGRVLVEVAGNSRTESVQIPDVDRETIRTDIVLDSVGRTSEGGEMVVGSMSTRGGVEEFNVSVGDDSWLQTLSSTNNALEVVNVEHLEGAEGSLYLGVGSETAGALNRDMREFNFSDNRLGFRDLDNDTFADANGGGLYDVQVFNAEGFSSEIKLSAALTVNSNGKYLEDEVGNELEEMNAFDYILGDGGNNLFLTVENNLSREPDFELNIAGGAEDDRINLWDVNGNFAQTNGNVAGAVDLAKDGISIDGGGGENTLEIISNTGQRADGRDAYADVINIQNLIIAGDQDTAQELVAGNIRNDVNELDTLTIATDGNDSTEIERMILDTDFAISGKNQTFSRSANGDDDQSFNRINIVNLETIPGAEETEFTVNLDNTARSTGSLTVADLNVDWDAGEIVVTDTVNLFSNGRLDTFNTVQDFAAPEIDELNFFGTQDLNVHVSDIAEDVPFEINGEELEGDLNLAVNGALLEDDGDDILGNVENDNVLALYGVLDDVTPTIEGFQELMFGLQGSGDLAELFGVGTIGAEGTIDLEDTEGVEEYIVARMSGNLILENLSSTVTLGDDTGVAGQFLASAGDTLEMIADDDAEGVLDLSVATNSVGDGFITGNGSFLQGLVAVDVQNFETVNADFAQPATGSSWLRVDLLLDSEARDLNITGGAVEAEGVFEADRLDLVSALATTLNTVDISAYEGWINDVELDEFAGTDTEFILDSDFAWIDLRGDKPFQEISFTEWNAPGNTLADGSLDDAATVEIKITYRDAEGEIQTTTVETSVSEEMSAQTSAGDSYRLLNNLTSKVSADENFDANMELMFEDEDGVVGTSTSILELMDFFDDTRDGVFDRMSFNPDYAAGEIGIGFQIRPDKDSDIPTNWVDRIVIRAENEDGSPIFDSDNMVTQNNVRTAAPIDIDTYNFQDDGDYQVTVNFTEYDEDADLPAGSFNWHIDDYTTARLDDGALVNEDTMTLLDLGALGVTEDNLDELIKTDITIGMEDGWEIGFDFLLDDYSLEHYEDGLFYLVGDQIPVRSPLGVNVQADNVTVAPGESTPVTFTVSNNTADPIDEVFTVTLDDANGNEVYTARQNVILASRGDQQELTFTVDTDALELAEGAYTVDVEFGDEVFDNVAIFGVDGDVNTAPVAVDDPDAFTVAQGESVVINVADDLLYNDSDADSDTLTITTVDQLGTEDGTAVLSADGTTITFTAAADYEGAATFEYTLFDGVDTDTAEVTGAVTADPTIEVTAANDGDTFTASDETIETFTVGNTASYEYFIDNFDIGEDFIEMPAGTTMDNTALDGEATLQWASDGVIVDITLIGLTDAQDTALATLGGLGDSLVIA